MSNNQGLKVYTRVGTVTIDASDVGVEIGIEGYGLAELDDGPFIYIDMFCDGAPKLLVWTDINNPNPTHTIDISGALETNREVAL